MGQIVMLDLVFSIDSITTAVGIAPHVPIMVLAVVVAVVVMLIAATPLANFLAANPTVMSAAATPVKDLPSSREAAKQGRYIGWWHPTTQRDRPDRHRTPRCDRENEC